MTAFNQADPSIVGLDQLRNQALVSNLWVILATILCSAVLSLPFAESGFVELFSGFFVYFLTNCFALWAAYRGAHRLALFGYTTQVFLCTTVAMILMEDQPAHMVLAMANFVLLHAVVLGRRWALTVTALMVLLLVFASWGGEAYGLEIRTWLDSDPSHLRLTEQTALTSLLTTTFSTGYLITTTVSLQERARAALSEAHNELGAAKLDLEHRHDRVRILSDAGADAAAASSAEELYESVSKALFEGLPSYQCKLLPISDDDSVSLRFGTGPLGKTFSSSPELEEYDRRFVKTLIALFDGAHSRIEADRRLRAAERLEGVGRLAASVAHDFNNLLMPIHGSYDLLEHHGVIPTEMQKVVEPGLAATRQAKALVKKLLVHARSLDLHVEHVDFRSIVESSEALLRTFVVDSIDLQITLPTNPVFVLADRIELEQVLLNLVLNALSAVDANGKVLITLSNDDSDVFLEVRDNGPGIPESQRKWVLEPFNSTRPEGSGLGLSTVERIARSGGGQVQIDTSPEGGATVTVSLPTVIPALSHNSNSFDSRTRARPLNVLLVEDDPHVRSILKEMLYTLGHICMAVCDGNRAVEVLKARAEINLVITDYQMPILNGVELIERMRSIDDLRPVILLSGYGPTVSDKVRSRPTAILGKPVRLDQLDRVLAENFPVI